MRPFRDTAAACLAEGAESPAFGHHSQGPDVLVHRASAKLAGAMDLQGLEHGFGAKPRVGAAVLPLD